MKNELEYFEKFGYKYFGPLLFNFSKWLLKEVNKNKIKKVYFLSRDGFIMKKAFDMINNTEIKTYYFYASRRSTIVPLLWKLNNETEIFDVIVFNKKIMIKSFLKKVGLDNYDVSEYLEKYNLSLTDYIDINDRKDFDKLLKDIFQIIQQNSKKEWKSLMKYAKINDFNGKVAIVDIGWFGSMQNSLENLFDNVDIYGYYFGLVPNKKICKNKSFGYLFDTNKNIKKYDDLHNFINIFEFLFLAQHGSVKCYKDDVEKVEFYKYEYAGMDEEKYAKAIQNSALKFIKEQRAVNENESIDTFINFFIKPNYETSKKFGNIKFNDDDFRYIAKPKSIIRYVFDLKKFKNDFINSSWRIGFLKRMLVIPLPYDKINNLFRKIYLRKKVK